MGRQDDKKKKIVNAEVARSSGDQSIFSREIRHPRSIVEVHIAWNLQC